MVPFWWNHLVLFSPSDLLTQATSPIWLRQKGEAKNGSPVPHGMGELSAQLTEGANQVAGFHTRPPSDLLTQATSPIWLTPNRGG